jgi:arylsulfatase A-like enzyme
MHVNLHNDNLVGPGFGIPEEMTTIPKKLKALGYKTHHIGKWHAGFSTPSRTPHGRGFDSSLGYLFAYNDYLHGYAEQGCENASVVNDPYPVSETHVLNPFTHSTWAPVRTHAHTRTHTHTHTHTHAHAHTHTHTHTLAHSSQTLGDR